MTLFCFLITVSYIILYFIIFEKELSHMFYVNSTTPLAENIHGRLLFTILSYRPV